MMEGGGGFKGRLLSLLTPPLTHCGGSDLDLPGVGESAAPPLPAWLQNVSKKVQTAVCRTIAYRRVGSECSLY